MKNNIKKKNKTLLISIVCALLIVSAAGATVFYLQRKANQNNDTSINYGPPTKEEIEASQDAKKDILEESDDDQQTETPPNQQTQLKDAVINISFADIADQKLEVRAFTTSTIEGDGTCTVTATKDGKKVSRDVPAFIDARSTICNPVFIPTSELSTGSWEVTVSFLSSTHKGSSGPIKVEVR